MVSSQQNYSQTGLTPKYRIIAMGQTGSGKSTVLNTLALGKHSIEEKIFAEGEEFYSETQLVQSTIGYFKRQNTAPVFQFMDTPGFMDTNDNDLENVVKVCDALDQLKEGINIVLFCFPAATPRYSADLQKSMQWLGIILGNGVYKHVKICVTQVDRLNEKQKQNALLKVQNSLIPTIKKHIKVEVIESLLIYNHNSENDGLDELLLELEQNQQNSYLPEINQTIVENFDKNDPYGSAKRILEKSEIMKQLVQELDEQRIRNEQTQRKLEQKQLELGQMNQFHLEEIQQLRQFQQEERMQNQKQLQDLQMQQALQMKQINDNFKQQMKLMEQQQKEQKEQQRILFERKQEEMRLQREEMERQLAETKRREQELRAQAAARQQKVVYVKVKRRGICVIF